MTHSKSKSESKIKRNRSRLAKSLVDYDPNGIRLSSYGSFKKCTQDEKYGIPRFPVCERIRWQIHMTTKRFQSCGDSALHNHEVRQQELTVTNISHFEFAILKSTNLSSFCMMLSLVVIACLIIQANSHGYISSPR